MFHWQSTMLSFRTIINFKNIVHLSLLRITLFESSSQTENVYLQESKGKKLYFV